MINFIEFDLSWQGQTVSFQPAKVWALATVCILDHSLTLELVKSVLFLTEPLVAGWEQMQIWKSCQKAEKVEKPQ